VTAAAMHIALIASPERWRSERELVRRLAIGLLGEGATVTVIEPVPERDPESVLPELVRSDLKCRAGSATKCAFRSGAVKSGSTVW